MKVGLLTEKDLPELARLYFQLNGVETETEKMRQRYQLMAEDKRHFLLGCWDENGKLGGSILGIICFDIVGSCRPFMVIENMIVSQEKRRSGIGRLLVEKIEEIARREDCYYTMLISRAQRTEAHRFYQAVGYELGVVQGFKKYL